MHIAYNGFVSKKEYSSAVNLHFHRAFKWIKTAGGVILGILIVALTITIINQPSTISALFPGILFPFIFLTFPWWIPLLQTVNYNNQGNIYRAPIRGVVDDTGVTISGQYVKTNFLWGAYTHYVRGDDFVLVYQGKNSFNIFTKAMFQSLADWETFLAALEEKTTLKK